MKLKTKTIRPGTQIRGTAYARPTVNIWSVSERAAVTTSLGTFHFEMNLLGASDAAQVVSQSYGLNGIYGPTQFLILTLDKCGWRRLKKTYGFFLIGGHADLAPHHPLEILNPFGRRRGCGVRNTTSVTDRKCQLAIRAGPTSPPVGSIR